MSDADSENRRRRLAAITVEDRIKSSEKRANGVPKSQGKPKLYGYGHGYLCRIGSTHRRSTISNTLKSGIPLSDPVLAVAWGLARRGKRDLAVGVLKEFGYATKYKVSHRTIKLIGAPTRQPGAESK